MRIIPAFGTSLEAQNSNAIIMRGALHEKRIDPKSSFHDTGCRLCSFTPKMKRGNSGPKDLILTFAVASLRNAPAFVSSCRTAGCRASIVILADHEAATRYSAAFYDHLYNCGVEIINIGFHNITDRQDIFFIRYLYYEKFLRERHGQYDRVILTDLYDVIFQADPFFSEFARNKVYFSSEKTPLRENSYNVDYIYSCWKNLSLIDPSKMHIKTEEFEKKMLDGDIINCGVIAGGYGSILKFILYMQNIGNKNTWRSHADDQGCLNLFLRGNFFDDLFDYEIDPWNSLMVNSMDSRYIYSNYELQKHTFGDLPDKNSASAILHQIDRNQFIPIETQRVCPTDLKDNDIFIQVKVEFQCEFIKDYRYREFFKRLLKAYI